ncbi:MAG: hypothetical protein QM779_05090 [Propionicimonas sp.]|uniref:hypothetical protein n=1 Tax=Propionicimonas sp. TaxID=1955623 RepID=UPI003D0E23DD
MQGYLLAESVFTVETTVNLILDTRLAEALEYLDDPVTTVAQTVYGDHSDGVRPLEPPRRGDNDITIAWTPDRRLASVSYKSVGVGSKLVGAAAKVIATVVGLAIRSDGTSLGRRSDASDAELDEPPDPTSVRKAWDAAHTAAADHRSTYAGIADRCTKKLGTLRGEVVDGDDAVAGARKLARIRQLEQILDAALKETSKVDAMFSAWSEAHLVKIPRALSQSIALDAVPVHEDASNEAPQQDPNAVDDDSRGLKSLWEHAGVWIEVGPSLTNPDWRPNEDGSVDGASLRGDLVYWRIPRVARLWVWRRGASGTPILEKSADVVVTDRFSESTSMPLDGRFFGEASVDITFGDLGFPSKLVVGDKSAVGAIADAIGGVPDQVVAGLDAATKIGTSADALRDAADVRSLEVIKRQVEQRSKELELQGINATADSYAELKRLQQQVDIATAQGSLAPPSALATLQNELAEATARRDLDAVNRDSAQAAELAGVRAEIARLEAQIQLLQARAQLPEGTEGR